MPKIKIKKFDIYEFVYKTTINVRDINYGGHLGNDSMVGIIHEARINMLDQMGFSELNLGDGKTGSIMTDIAVAFKSPGFMLEKIEIYSHIDEINACSFRVFHKIVRGETVLAYAETGIVSFNYETNSVVEIPEEFIQRLDRWNSPSE